MCFNAAELKAIQRQIQDNRERLNRKGASGDVHPDERCSTYSNRYTLSNPTAQKVP